MEKLAAIVQTLLPHHPISRLTGWIAGMTFWPVRTLLIRVFMWLYKIDLSEAENSDPASYPSFNALFTRALRSDARPLPAEQSAIVSPVDGRISQCGTISDNLILQAKGREFAVSDLLGVGGEQARTYNNGSFITIYLAPYNYHRIHAPWSGQLRQMTFVPGRLFSVSPATARAVRNLYARNERVVFHFECEFGPAALVLVGAMNVGSIETVHEGVIAPGGRQLRHWHYDPPKAFGRGEELARFNLGSTAIVLFGEQGPQLAASLKPAATLNFGQTIASFQTSDSR